MVGIGNKPHELCGAKTRSGDKCKLKAGWGTDHLGEGRCKFHGGLSTGPSKEKAKGNKNAVKTGEYESIVRSALNDEEKQKFDSVSTSVNDQLDEQIRTAVFREYRMMKRIADASNEKFHVVEKKYKKGATSEGPIEVKEDVSEHNIKLINRIEEALTRVQGKIARLINIKRKHEKNDPDVNVDINNYISALEGEAKEVWSDD